MRDAIDMAKAGADEARGMLMMAIGALLIVVAMAVASDPGSASNVLDTDLAVGQIGR